MEYDAECFQCSLLLVFVPLLSQQREARARGSVTSDNMKAVFASMAVSATAGETGVRGERVHCVPRPRRVLSMCGRSSCACCSWVHLASLGITATIADVRRSP